MRAILFTASLAIALPAAAVPPLPSPVPLVIQHSGRVLDANDQGSEGTLAITFTLYKDFEKPRNADDTVYWTETRSVQVFKGVYVALGDVADGGSALSVAAFGDGSEERWLGIKIGDDPEMKPRLQVGSVPYAMRAAFAAEAGHASSAGTADVADNLDCANCVGAGEIATGAVERAQIKNDAVGPDQIDDGAVHFNHIAADAVQAGHIALDAVGSSEIAPNAVGRSELDDDAVGPDELAADAVRSDHIAADAVGSSEIAANAVGPDELDDDAVHSDDIAADAVGSSEIAANAVGRTELDDDAVGPDEIDDDAIRSNHIRAGEVTLDKLAGRDPITGLITGLNAERLGGKTAAEVAALADPTVAAALQKLAGVQRPCSNGAGVETFDGAEWGTCFVGSRSCREIKARSVGPLLDGLYTIDPDAGGPAAPFQVWCDMNSDGGGWTLVFRNAELNYDHDDADNLPVTPSKTKAKLASSVINLISGQTTGVAYELRLAGAATSTLMKASEPFYVGQKNDHQVTIEYDCNRDGGYEKSKTWNDWTDDRVAGESASWIRDWVYPQNGQCNAWNGGNVMQWWGPGKTETPSTSSRPISATNTSYTHDGDIKVWVR